MTATYRLKGAGWLIATVAIALGFYLVSLRVAQERKKLEAIDARIAAAHRDIRALESEFDTRANLVQLERWNGDTLALAAPTAGQFVRDEAQLAAIDNGASAGAMHRDVRTAALVVPSIVDPVRAASPPAPALAGIHAAAQPPIQVAVATPLPVATSHATVATARVMPGRTLADLAAATPLPSLAGVRPRAVALLDAKLLSDATLGDLLAKAQREAKVAR